MRPVLLVILLVPTFAASANAKQLKEITNSIGIKLVLIPAGSFTMGSPESEEGRKDDETTHEVTFSKSFYLGAYEVTQEQYKKVMGKNPSFSNGAKRPVERVSWHDANSFCQKLSDLPQEKSAGREYRLPTEAEWEYSCRASSTTSYCFGDSVQPLEEFALQSQSRITGGGTVGSKKANRWGLFDMHGNVSEWCLDVYAPYKAGDLTDTKMELSGDFPSVVRGGGWSDEPAACRSASRTSSTKTETVMNRGFRIAMSLPSKPEAFAPSK